MQRKQIESDRVVAERRTPSCGLSAVPFVEKMPHQRAAGLHRISVNLLTFNLLGEGTFCLLFVHFEIYQCNKGRKVHSFVSLRFDESIEPGPTTQLGQGSHVFLDLLGH